MGWTKRIVALGAFAIVAGYATQSRGATLEVPTVDHPTISDAISSATAGDTILITDSAIYEEGLVEIDKATTITAEAGNNPTILGSLRFMTGSDGSRVGSNNAGRINIGDGNFVPPASEPGTFGGPEFMDFQTTGGTVLFENLFVHGPAFFTMVHPNDNVSTQTVVQLQDVDINGGAGGATCFGIEDSINLELTRVVVKGYTQQAIYDRQSGKIVNISLNNCDIGELHNETGMFGGGGTINKIQNNTTDTEINIYNITGSVIRGGSSHALNFSEGNTSVTLTNSVVITDGNSDIGGSPWFGFNYDRNGSAILIHAYRVSESVPNPNNRPHQPDSNHWLTVDHSDLISSGTALWVADNHTTGKTITVTNSNLIGLNDDVVVSGTENTGDVFSFSHNNVFSYGGGDLYGGDVVADGNSINEDPEYTNIEANDFTTQNSALHTADDSGGSIGVNSNFAGQVPVELSTFELN